MRMRLELDAETRRPLAESVARERGSLPWQAEVLLRQAVRRELRRWRLLQAEHTRAHECPQRQEVQR
jgi:hypothetical protein